MPDIKVTKLKIIEEKRKSDFGTIYEVEVLGYFITSVDGDEGDNKRIIQAVYNDKHLADPTKKLTLITDDTGDFNVGAKMIFRSGILSSKLGNENVITVMIAKSLDKGKVVPHTAYVKLENRTPSGGKRKTRKGRKAPRRKSKKGTQTRRA
jgi:hypothetical protein